jgi:hypothetical protein
MTISLSTSNPPTLQSPVPQHHHRHHGGAKQSGAQSNSASQTSAVTPAPSAPNDGETVEEPTATAQPGSVNILA